MGHETPCKASQGTEVGVYDPRREKGEDWSLEGPATFVGDPVLVVGTGVLLVV